MQGTGVAGVEDKGTELGHVKSWSADSRNNVKGFLWLLNHENMASRGMLYC